MPYTSHTGRRERIHACVPHMRKDVIHDEAGHATFLPTWDRRMSKIERGEIQMGRKKNKSGRKQFRESNYDQWKKTLEAVRKRLDDNPSPGENPAMTFPWKEDGVCLMPKLRPLNYSSGIKYEWPLLNDYIDTWSSQGLTGRKAYEQYLALEVWKRAGEKAPRGDGFYLKYYRDRRRWKHFMEDKNFTDEDLCGETAVSKIDGSALCERHAVLHIDKSMIPEIERRIAEIRKNGLANDRKYKQVGSFQPHKSKKDHSPKTLLEVFTGEKPPKQGLEFLSEAESRTKASKEERLQAQRLQAHGVVPNPTEESQPIPLNAENIRVISEMMQNDSSLTFIEATSRLENTLHSDVVTEEPDNTQDIDISAPQKKTTKSSAYSERKFSQSKDDQLWADRREYLKSGKARAKKKYDSHK